MSTSVFINEFHYDNVGTDTGEAIEILLPTGTDLTGWSLVLYNGSATVRSPYDTVSLGGRPVTDLGNGFSTVVVTFPSNGIQNGSPDGLALVDSAGSVVQFLSYEGSFEAASGPAAGLTSTDIGVIEDGTGPIGGSLQLTGTGSTAAEFTWTVTNSNTFGAVNTGQTLGSIPPSTVFISEIHYDNDGADQGEFIEVTGSAGTDLIGYSLVLYNGNGGGAYATVPLSGLLSDQSGGQGALAFDIAGIQNGSPDGVALVGPGGSVIEFLSYEGSFVAADGPAAGLTSTDIGVFEPSDTPVGQSLQLIDGVWTGPAPSSRGSINGIDNSTVRLISEIQGNRSTQITTSFGRSDGSPLLGETVVIQGVVTAVLPELRALFVQEESRDADGDRTTSEGIFIFTGGNAGDPQTDASGRAIAAGQIVTVEGTVSEFFGMTQIGSQQITIDDAGNNLSLVPPTGVSLPVAGDIDEFYEQYEGMLVQFEDRLVVSEYFQLGRFGQVVLTAGDRPYQYTHTDDTPTAAEFEAFQAELARRRIILDDDDNFQNSPVLLDGSDPLGADDGGRVFYPQPGGLSTGTQGENFFRGGDVINDLTGVLHWSFAGAGGTDAWRIRPTEANPIAFEVENERPAAPPAVGGNVKVASFNVLNYFTTLDAGSNTVGPSALEPRGANSEAELARQTEKLAAALLALDADVLGLVEIENSQSEAPLQRIVDALNAQAGAGTYAFIATGFDGTDAIKTAILYKPGVVTPTGTTAVLEDPAFLDPNGTGLQRNRPALAQAFRVSDRANADFGAVFNVVVNHLKSKGDSGLAGNPQISPSDVDQGDGQGFWNSTRAAAAAYLVNTWIPTDPTGSGDADYLIIGDLNAYRGEDPIRAITQAGYTDLIRQFGGDDAYSYVFDGQLGYLDYALSSSSLTSQVTGAAEWHINADESDLFDYNNAVREGNERDFEVKPGGNPLYEPNAVRTSDHDPVIIGLDLSVPVVEPVVIEGTRRRDTLVGTEANEIFVGLQGSDEITTGGGEDVIRLTSLRDARDRILDFEVGRDRFDVSLLLGSIGYTGSDPIADGYISFGARRGRTFLRVDLDGAGPQRERVMAELVGDYDVAALNQAGTFVFEPA